MVVCQSLEHVTFTLFKKQNIWLMCHRMMVSAFCTLNFLNPLWNKRSVRYVDLQPILQVYNDLDGNQDMDSWHLSLFYPMINQTVIGKSHCLFTLVQVILILIQLPAHFLGLFWFWNYLTEHLEYHLWKNRTWLVQCIVFGHPENRFFVKKWT